MNYSVQCLSDKKSGLSIHAWCSAEWIYASRSTPIIDFLTQKISHLVIGHGYQLARSDSMTSTGGDPVTNVVGEDFNNRDSWIVWSAIVYSITKVSEECRNTRNIISPITLGETLKERIVLR
jgi:hypothetical protein